jgi:hypothetical protein
MTGSVGCEIDRIRRELLIGYYGGRVPYFQNQVIWREGAVLQEPGIMDESRYVGGARIDGGRPPYGWSTNLWREAAILGEHGFMEGGGHLGGARIYGGRRPSWGRTDLWRSATVLEENGFMEECHHIGGERIYGGVPPYWWCRRLWRETTILKDMEPGSCIQNYGAGDPTLRCRSGTYIIRSIEPVWAVSLWV